ncbi:hypothetical protein GCM10028805_03530 [Spirosoma harenae]
MASLFNTILLATTRLIRKRVTTLSVLCAMLCVLRVSSVQAQTFPLQIQVSVMPPYSAYLQDYPGAGQQVRVFVINTGRTNFQIRLAGQLTGDNGIEIRTSPNYRPPRPLTIPPGQTLLTRNDLEGLFDLNQIEVTGIDKNLLARGFPLPDGTYQLCIRAYNETATNTAAVAFGQALSAEFPLGCSAPIVVKSVEPPILISPLCDASIPAIIPQSTVFTWTPPAGVSPASVDYTLRIVELPQENVDPNVFIDAITLPKSGVEVRNLRTSTFLYGPTQPPFVVGKRYAWRVQAIDRSRKLNFQNDGKSPVCAFTYGTEPTGPKLPIIPVVSNDSTKSTTPKAFKSKVFCKAVELPSEANPLTGPLDGKTVKVGEFDLIVATAKYINGGYTGEGRVTWNGAPIKVLFQNLKVNGQNQVFDGDVNSDSKGPGTPNIPLGQIDGFGGLPNNYFDQVKNTLVEAAKQAVAIPLPLKYDGKIGTVGINQMSFSPVGAQMDMVVGVSLPEANLNLFLAAVNVCTRPQEKLPNTGTLYLVKDMPMPIPGGIGQKFVFKKSDPNSGKPEGTYATITNGDFDKVHGVMDLNLGSTILKLDDGKGAVKAGDLVGTITADFVQWSDWVGTVSLPPFQVPGLSGVTFTGNDIVYDHSDKANPDGFNLPKDYNGDTGLTFHGTYFKKVTVELPKSFKDNPRIGVSVNGGILDGSGFTGFITSANKPILDYTKGSLAGFGFGIDDIQWTIVQNSNRGGNILGKLQFPISTDFFSYSCSLSGGFDNVQFTASPKDGYNVPLLAATMDLNANTAINVTYKSGQKTQISMSLGGKVAIDVKKFAGSGSVGKAIDTVLPKLYFEKFTIGNTSTPGATALGGSGLYLNTGEWSLTNDVAKANNTPSGNAKKGGGPWSPDDELNEWFLAPSDDAKSSLAGFPLDFDPPTIVSTKEGTGVRLGIGLHLGEGGDDAKFVQAHGSLDVLGSVTSDGNRFKPSFSGVYPRSISVDGAIGPLTVKGGLDFINSDGIYGNGIKGNADVTIPGFDVKIKMMMLFGNVNGFKYGFVDGSVQFPGGIPVVGPIVLTGLGGGMHYNMSMTVNGKDALADPSQITKLAKASEDNKKALPPVDLTQPGKTLSGTVFKPAKGGWGLTAKIYAGLVDPHVFNASLAMTVDFAGGSMGGINMHGNANVISQSGDGDGSDGVAHAVMDINYAQGVLDASLGVDAKVLTAKVHVPFMMHVASGKDWYVKLGDPKDENNRIAVTLLDVGNDKSALRAYLAAKGYLAVGVGPNLGGLPPLPQKVSDFLSNGSNTLPEAKMAFKQRSLPDLLATGNDYKLLMGGSIEGKLKVQVQPFRLWADAIVGFDAALAKNLKCGESNSTPQGIMGWYGMGQAYAYLGGGIDIYVDVWFFSGSLSLMTLQAGAVLKAGVPDPTWADGKVKIKGEVLDGLISVETTQSFSFGSKCTPVYNGDPLKDIDIIADFTPQEGETEISCRPTMAVAFNMPMNQPFEVHIPNAIRKYKFIPDQPVFTYKDGKQAYKPFVDLNPIKWSGDAKSYVLSASAFLPSYAVCKLAQNVVIKEIGPGGQLDDPFIDSKGIREARHQEKSVAFTLGKQPDEIPVDAIQRMSPVTMQKYFLKKELAQGFLKGQYKGLAVLDDVGNPAFQYTADFTKDWDESTVATVPIQYDKNGRITFDIPNGLINEERYTINIVKRKKATGNGSGSALTSVKYVSVAQGKAKFLQTSLNVAAVQASATASGNNKGNLLFSIPFKTSKYNTFLEKMKGLSLKATDYQAYYKLELRSTAGPGYEPFDSFDMNGYTQIAPGVEILTPMLTVSSPYVQTPSNPFETTMKTKIYDVMQALHDNGDYDIVDNYTYLGKEMNEDGYVDQGNYKYEGSTAVPIDPTLNQTFVAYEDWREKIPVSNYQSTGWFPDLKARPLDKAVEWSYNGSDMVRFTYLRDHIMLSDMGALVQFFKEMQKNHWEALRKEYQLRMSIPSWYNLPKGMTEQQFITKYVHDASIKLSYGAGGYGSSPTMTIQGGASHGTYASYWQTIEDPFYKQSNYDYGDVPQRTEKSPMYIAFRYEIPTKDDIAIRNYTNNFIIGEINKFVPLQTFFPTTFYYFPMGGN